MFEVSKDLLGRRRSPRSGSRQLIQQETIDSLFESRHLKVTADATGPGCEGRRRVLLRGRSSRVQQGVPEHVDRAPGTRGRGRGVVRRHVRHGGAGVLPGASGRVRLRFGQERRPHPRRRPRPPPRRSSINSRPAVRSPTIAKDESTDTGSAAERRRRSVASCPARSCRRSRRRPRTRRSEPWSAP